MQHWGSAHVRWLVGTLVFGLMFAMILRPLVHPVGVIGGVLSLFGFVASFGAAYEIGRKVRTNAWWLGPPVAIVIVVIILVLIPNAGGAPEATQRDMLAAEVVFLALLRLVGAVVLILLAVLYGWLGSRGVNAALEAESERRWQEDEAFRTMFQRGKQHE